jgi:hypothetical protein
MTVKSMLVSCFACAPCVLFIGSEANAAQGRSRSRQAAVPDARSQAQALYAEGEFARDVPYRTNLPRPVVGSAGLVAEAWQTSWERYGAPQLSRRFKKAANRSMAGADWAAWIATKAIIDRVNAEIKNALTSPDMQSRLAAFEPWYMTPAETAARIQSDYEKYGYLIKLTGTRLE